MSALETERFHLIVPYGTEHIPCEVHRSRARTATSIAIHVEPDGRVLVDAPWKGTRADIRQAVSKRSAWISRQLRSISERQRHLLPREYVSGESVHYLGRRYCLKVIVAPEEAAKLRGMYLEVRVPEPNAGHVQRRVEIWHQQRASIVLRDRVRAVSHELRWLKHEPPVRIRRMQRQWGSCSPQGRITLNIALIKAPRECIDYVIRHELCHLQVRGHGPDFYRTLTRCMPDWQRVKERLDGMADRLLAR